MALLSLAAIIGMFSFSGEHVFPLLRGSAVEPLLLKLGVPNAIGFNLCIGFITSVFFWWLVVHVPEVQRRNMLRKNLGRRYRDFRYNTIQMLIWSSGATSTSRDQVDLLLDKEKFKDFFRGEKWDEVANGLQRDKSRLRSVMVEFEILAHEISYTLNNVVVQDAHVHTMFRVLSENIFRLRNDRVDTYEHVKSISQFLWSVLAGWSFVTGYTNEDPIEQMLELI
ncbi:MAG: hypothetical protein V4454_18860 [Pseudomonadota bacterium]